MPRSRRQQAKRCYEYYFLPRVSTSSPDLDSKCRMVGLRLRARQDNGTRPSVDNCRAIKESQFFFFWAVYCMTVWRVARGDRVCMCANLSHFFHFIFCLGACAPLNDCSSLFDYYLRPHTTAFPPPLPYSILSHSTSHRRLGKGAHYTGVGTGCELLCMV